jgi:hypothetical protein
MGAANTHEAYDAIEKRLAPRLDSTRQEMS